MRRTLTALAVLTLVAPCTFTRTAEAACPELPISQPFARWGDDGYYEPVPGGAFELALSWEAVGSPLLDEEIDPFGLDGPDVTSVRLRGGESITSPVLCVTKQHPHMRFLARARDRKSHLAIEALWTDDRGKHKANALEDQDAKHHGSWIPSKQVKLKKVLPKAGDDVRDVRLRLSVKENAGEWLVDDVYVDPFKRG